MDLVADSFVSTYNRFKYVDFAYSNSVTETKIISRSAHHISGDFMSEVFTDTSYITLAITISILYFLNYVWMYCFEDHPLKMSDSIFFIGNLVNQPFPKNMIRLTRVSSILLLRTFDIFTFVVALIYGCIMISTVMSTEEKMKLIDSLDQLNRMKNIQVYIVRNKFVHDVIDDVESLKKLKTSGYLWDTRKCSVVSITTVNPRLEVDL